MNYNRKLKTLEESITQNVNDDAKLTIPKSFTAANVEEQSSRYLISFPISNASVWRQLENGRKKGAFAMTLFSSLSPRNESIRFNKQLHCSEIGLHQTELCRRCWFVTSMGCGLWIRTTTNTTYTLQMVPYGTENWKCTDVNVIVLE